MLTSGLTLLTALALFLFGGQVLNGFAFALVCGIIVGTYSSVYIASPILIFGQNLLEMRKRRGGAGPATVPKTPAIAPKAPKEPKEKVRGGAARAK